MAATGPAGSSGAASDPMSRRNTPLLSPTPSSTQIDGLSDSGRTNRSRRLDSSADGRSTQVNLKEAERIFHEVFDPALEYITSLLQQTILVPQPSSLPLLTMIRLNDRVLQIADQRGTTPLATYLQGQKMALWPLYRKEMDAHVDSLKRLADEAEGKGLSGFMGRGVKDQTVRAVASRYAAVFSSVTALSEEAEEAMIFSR